MQADLNDEEEQQVDSPGWRNSPELAQINDEQEKGHETAIRDSWSNTPACRNESAPRYFGITCAGIYICRKRMVSRLRLDE